MGLKAPLMSGNYSAHQWHGGKNRKVIYSPGFSGFGSGAGSSCAKLTGADRPTIEPTRLKAKTIAKAIIKVFINMFTSSQ